MKITSLQNSKIKDVARLRERRHRDESQLFLIEGFREVKRAVEAGWEIDAFFYAPDWFLGSQENQLLEKIRAPHHECTKDVFQKISYRDRPDGLLAIGKQKHRTLKEFSFSQCAFILIAESIEKPGNLGTILRSCDAVGVDGVILCDPTTDLYNPNVVRASVGTLFSQRIFESSTSEAIPFLKEKGIEIIAATPAGDKIYTEENFQGPIAIAMGTEQYGLTQFWMDHADKKVKIPMRGVADSLNVSSATTLLLYEVLRQRNLSR